MNHSESRTKISNSMLSSVIFINADLSLILKCFVPPVVFKISSLQVTLPFPGSLGKSALFAFMVSGQLDDCAF